MSPPVAPDVPNDPAPRATIQFVHASSNAPAVNVTTGGGSQTAFAGVDYKESPLPLTVEGGASIDIGVDAILPDGSTATVVEIPAQAFNGDTIYTVFAAGNVGDEGDTALQAIQVTRSAFFVPSDTVRVTALHAAAGAPAVDIYVTAPDAEDLSMETPINGDTPVQFGDSLGPLDIGEGEYRIRITAAGDASAVVFDTGAVTLDGGSDPIIAAVDNTNAGSASPVSALLVTRSGVAEIQDVQTTAELRVTHAVPDVGAPVDVWVDGEVAISPFDFPDTVGPIALAGGSYVFQVAVGGAAVINPDGDATTLANGVYYDAIAVGSVAADNLGLATFADDRRRVATAAKLRLAHLSPSTPDVDIYLVDETVGDIAAVDPSFSDIPYLFNSAYLEVAPGTYNIFITPAGTKDIAIQALAVPLPAGSLNTAFARDADTGEAGPGLILLDDLSP